MTKTTTITTTTTTTTTKTGGTKTAAKISIYFFLTIFCSAEYVYTLVRVEWKTTALTSGKNYLNAIF